MAINESMDSGHDESVDLRQIVVRPIRAHERPHWEYLMSIHHYLGFRHLTGESLKYVAEFQDAWLALLGWGSGSFKFGARDRWIGWTPEQQWQRLHLLVCNQRFLILPGTHIPNLASRVLSLNVKRLSRDWEEFHGHPVLLAESFVDPSRFNGTCYRAAGWITLGKSRGFGRNGGRYFYHGRQKVIMVYPLVRSAQSMLSSAFLMPELSRRGGIPLVDLNKVQLQGEGGLLDVLEQIRDPRKRRGIRHSQISILAIGICACLSGMRSFAAISQWAKGLSQTLLERLGCSWDWNKAKYRAPSEPTLRRTIQSVDADEVDSRVGGWLAEQSKGTALAFDGKTLRGSGKGDGKPVHLLSALLHEEGIVVAQQAVSDKSNEITAMKPLLDPLDLQGKTVTADAMHAQVEHARYLKEDKNADYLFTIKANQPGLLNDIQDLKDQDFSPCA
jgi:hypothetical protein